VYVVCWDQGTNCECLYKGVEYHRLLQYNRQDEHHKYLCIILRGRGGVSNIIYLLLEYLDKSVNKIVVGTKV
jgi:hypothetical protein